MADAVPRSENVRGTRQYFDLSYASMIAVTTIAIKTKRWNPPFQANPQLLLSRDHGSMN